MSQRVLYIDSHAAAKATNVSDQIKAITAWMDQLLGSSHDGKIVKEIRHFHIRPLAKVAECEAKTIRNPFKKWTFARGLLKKETLSFGI